MITLDRLGLAFPRRFKLRCWVRRLPVIGRILRFFWILEIAVTLFFREPFRGHWAWLEAWGYADSMAGESEDYGYFLDGYTARHALAEDRSYWE